MYRFVFVLLGMSLVILVINALCIMIMGAGPFSIDEAMYHLMAINVSEGRFVEVWNGYQEFPSAELRSNFIIESNDRLVVTYPAIYALIASPFYNLLGFPGLFFLNFIAFLTVLRFTYLISMHLSNDKQLGLLSCFILGSATYFADYALAAWPHAISMLSIIIAFWSITRSGVFTTINLSGENNSQPKTIENQWILLAGLMLGLGTGARIDVIFALPVLLLPLLLLRPLNFRSLTYFFIGLIPALLLLSAINLEKFGSFVPFSYGPDRGQNISRYLPLLLIAATCLLAIALSPLRILKYYAVAILGFCVFALLISQTAREYAYQFLHGSYQLLVDFRIRDLNQMEPALSRGPTGGMVYIGALKKSLLQSLPWLPILIVPVVLIVKRYRATQTPLLIALHIPIVCYFVPFAFQAWHGGLGLNLRYWIPMLPFMSILAAYAWKELFAEKIPASQLKKTNLLIASVLIFILAAVIKSFEFTAGAQSLVHIPTVSNSIASLRDQEFIFLTIPLILSSLFAVFLCLHLCKVKTDFSKKASWFAMIATFTWSIGITYFHDIPISAGVRQGNLHAKDLVLPYLDNKSGKDSILFAPFVDPYYALMEHGQIRIANPAQDSFADFTSLATFQLTQGRAAYAILYKPLFQYMRQRGMMNPFYVKLLLDVNGSILIQLFLRDAPPLRRNTKKD